MVPFLLLGFITQLSFSYPHMRKNVQNRIKKCKKGQILLTLVVLPAFFSEFNRLNLIEICQAEDFEVENHTRDFSDVTSAYRIGNSLRLHEQPAA